MHRVSNIYHTPLPSSPHYAADESTPVSLTGTHYTVLECSLNTQHTHATGGRTGEVSLIDLLTRTALPHPRQ